VIIPVFNEAATIGQLLQRLFAGPYPYPAKEIIVVDDGSVDGTEAVLKQWAARPDLLILRHVCNRGKGAAIRTALSRGRGLVTIIQDADLEYNPQDIPRVVEPVREGAADVVYGSRYLQARDDLPWTRFRVAVAVLNGLVRILYGQRLTDEATCYKALRTDLLQRMNLQAEGFDFCPELTAKACLLRCRILEVPISYAPRSRQEGKKISWRDGCAAVWTLLKWRFARRGPPLGPSIGDAQRQPPCAV
jgi:glycosyltransferase involved in cell wall biosynthesis